jgi:hypothetical protein
MNVPLCTATSNQYTPTSIPDGAGGAIVTWSDARSGAEDIYAQRISATGAIQWTANGVALCTATWEQRYPTIVSDGAGGAIVTWQDYRSGTNYDIYAQRISAAGTVQWTADGVALCTATGDQQYPPIVSDGAGGAIITWQDYRSTSIDIYAQRISAAGAVQWAVDGVALCAATSTQANPTIASDGAGGAIVTWYDFRSGTGDIYAQRISAAGTPQWTADGVALCIATLTQYAPTIVSDGAGGAIVGWYDGRTGGSNYDIYAQRISAAGTVQWTADGVALCTADNTQFRSKIVSDAANGAIVTWSDRRSGSNYDIYAQRISAGGTVQWTADGVALCTANGDQQYPAIVSDDAGGAIVAWSDLRSGTNYDIYTQRISAGGTVQWTADGVALCTAAGTQYEHTIASDGAGGAIVSWRDSRSGDYDIYTQRISAGGTVQWTTNGVALCTTGCGDATSIVADGAGGAIVTWGVSNIYAQRISAGGTVQWTANGVALCTATGEQSYPTITSDGAGGAIGTWQDYRSGNFDIYAQRISAAGSVQWTANGVALCTAAGSQGSPTIVADGAGGAVVTWQGGGIYAQRISPGGTVQWTANGVPLCTECGTQVYSPTFVADGAGGVIATWEDARNGSVDIYAQRVSADGTTQWTANGVALCTDTTEQNFPMIASDGAGGAIVTWHDARNADPDPWIDPWDIYAQQVDATGHLGGGCEAPRIQSIKDVPMDQGGKVLVLWSASCRDSTQALNISAYTLWRRVTTVAAQQALARGAVLVRSAVPENGTPSAGAIRMSPQGTAAVYWEFIVSVPARGASGYGYTATTTTDSMPGLIPYNVFFVDAKEASSSTFYVSAPDSGYSVDNLAPATPAPFTGQYAGGTATLHWAVNPAADLAEYRLYRGSTAGFVPGPGNLVAAQPDTGYVDAAGTPSYYKLCAVDVHGNASGFSTLLPSGTVDVPGPALPRAVFLAPPAPNPARGATTLRFGLPREARVELALYDQQGRRVRSLLSGTQPAGERTITWDGRDESGRALPAGLYFVRLASEGRTFVSRLAVIR